jgi:mono/diheme cytochrome c family protein
MAARRRVGLVYAAIAVAVLAVVASIVTVFFGAPSPRADPANAEQVALGKKVYAQHCTSCHGAQLEGQPGWREKLISGRMPAPPHDASGHTWHHPDEVLFGITKHGLVPGRYGPPGYQSDMPGFAGALSDDEIWAVVAFIKASWPDEIRKAQADLDRRHAARR